MRRIEKVKSVIKKCVSPKTRKRLILVYGKFLSSKYIEKKKCYGKENPDKTFYVIRRAPKGAGLLSNYGLVLEHLLSAEKRGLIPVIDMQDTLTYYNEEQPINGTYNAWEYYWEQPTQWELDDIKKSQNVILSSSRVTDRIYQFDDVLDDTKALMAYHRISLNIPVNKTTSEYVQQVKPKAFNDSNNRILGVAVRGTDYRLGLYGGIEQPTVEDIVKIVEKYGKEWDCNYVFLTTEEEEPIELFRESFGGRLLCTERQRFSNYTGDIPTPLVRRNRELDRYYTGLEYLSEMRILSECSCLICSKTSGSIMSSIWNGGKYEHRLIIDKDSVNDRHIGKKAEKNDGIS